jgi:hypothetical protein
VSKLEHSLVQPTDEGLDDLFRELTGKEPETDDQPEREAEHRAAQGSETTSRPETRSPDPLP